MNIVLLLLFFLSSSLAALYRDNYNRDVYVCIKDRNWYFGITSVNPTSTPSTQIMSFATASRTLSSENPFSGFSKLIGLWYGMPYRPLNSSTPVGGALQFVLVKDGNNWIGNLGEDDWTLTFVNNKNYKKKPGLCYYPDTSSKTMVGLWNRTTPAAGLPDPDGEPVDGGKVPYLTAQLCENGLGMLIKTSFVSGEQTFTCRLQGNFVVGNKGFVGEQDFTSTGPDEGIISQIFMMTKKNTVVGNFMFLDYIGVPEVYKRIEGGDPTVCGYNDEDDDEEDDEEDDAEDDEDDNQ
jgi:hypothetical protein